MWKEIDDSCPSRQVVRPGQAVRAGHQCKRYLIPRERTHVRGAFPGSARDARLQVPLPGKIMLRNPASLVRNDSGAGFARGGTRANA